MIAGFAMTANGRGVSLLMVVSLTLETVKLMEAHIGDAHRTYEMDAKHEPSHGLLMDLK